MQNTYSIKKVLNLNNLEKLIIFYGLTLGLSSLVSIKYSVVVPIGNFIRFTALTVKILDCKNFLYVIICSVYQDCFMLMVEKKL